MADVSVSSEPPRAWSHTLARGGDQSRQRRLLGAGAGAPRRPSGNSSPCSKPSGTLVRMGLRESSPLVRREAFLETQRS